MMGVCACLAWVLPRMVRGARFCLQIYIKFPNYKPVVVKNGDECICAYAACAEIAVWLWPTAVGDMASRGAGLAGMVGLSVVVD